MWPGNTEPEIVTEVTPRTERAKLCLLTGRELGADCSREDDHAIPRDVEPIM
jgi:hypothetical protein